LLLTFSLPALAEDAQAVPEDMAVWLEAYVASRSSFDGGIVPYPDSAKFIEGSAFAKPANGLLFNLEGIRGGNEYTEYIAVFWKRHAQNVFCCLLRVGGKGIGNVEEVAIDDRGVHLRGKKFILGKDAYCCPSEPYARTLRIVDSRLVDASSPSNKSLERTRER
jgi:hypothetical protein